MVEKDSDEYFEMLSKAENEAENELANILGLVKSSDLPPDKLNTFEYVENLFKRLSDPLVLPLVSEICEDVGRSYETEIRDYVTIPLWHDTERLERLKKEWESFGRRKFEDHKARYNAPTPFEMAYQWYWEWGAYPPPELLAMLFKCFELYFEARGELSLEEVFFGKPKKRSGNYSKRRYRNQKFIEFHFQLMDNYGPNKMSETEFARNLLKRDIENEMDGAVDVLDSQIENFIREYHRWKKTNIDSGSG